MSPSRIATVLAAVLITAYAQGLACPQDARGADNDQRKKSVVEKRERSEELKISVEDAIRAALANVKGRVHEIDVVPKKGKFVWVVEVIAADGRHFVVDVDGDAGTVSHIGEKSIEHIAGSATAGKLVFEKHCLGCHGADGKGSGPAGPLLSPPASDYTSESTRQKSDAELLHTIQEGRPGTAMRSFKRWLSKQEMRDVLAYVRILSSQGVGPGTEPSKP